jgi:hypothetical protein
LTNPVHYHRPQDCWQALPHFAKEDIEHRHASIQAVNYFDIETTAGAVADGASFEVAFDHSGDIVLCFIEHGASRQYHMRLGDRTVMAGRAHGRGWRDILVIVRGRVN